MDALPTVVSDTRSGSDRGDVLLAVENAREARRGPDHADRSGDESTHMTHDNLGAARKPLRTWPVIAIAVLFVATVIIGPLAPFEERLSFSLSLMLGAVGGALLITLWWLFFSRARWWERLGALVLVALGVAMTSLAVDPSIAGGAQGMLGYIFGYAFFAFALAIWAVATARMTDRIRYITFVPVLVLLGCVPILSIRTE